MLRRLPSHALLVALLVVSLTGVARAQDHPLVRQGLTLYQRADLEGALRAFERAEAADDLTRADLVTLLERRVMVQLAQLDRPAIDADLERLASIAPEHDFPRDVPPEVVETFRRLVSEQPGPLTVEAEPRTFDGEVEVRVQVRHDRASTVRAVRVAGRAEGEPWREALDEPLVVPLPDDGAVEYYAEVIGAGGAVIARDGTAAQPHILRQGDIEDGETDGGASPWLFVGLGAGVAAVAAVVTAVMLSNRGDGGEAGRTQPSFPMVEF